MPLKTFLNAQKTTQDFFPPVFDYLGWTDHEFTTFALIDYAGLANEYIKSETGRSLGTQVKGSVVKCTLPDGRAQIIVDLETTKALGFAQSIADLNENDFDFLHTPTTFGNKAQDVISGAASATGEAELFTTFNIEKNAPLPNLVDVLNNAPANYAPVAFTFKSCIKSEKQSYLNVNQAGATDDQGAMVYTNETIKISKIKCNR